MEQTETAQEVKVTKTEQKVLDVVKEIEVSTYSVLSTQTGLKERQLRNIFNSLKEKGLLKTRVVTQKKWVLLQNK